MEQKIERNCAESGHTGFRKILPFLAIPLAIGLMRGVGRHKFAKMHAMRQAEWKNGVPPMFAEWHRRAHAEETEKQAETTV